MLSQGHLDVILSLVEVELAFLGEPTQSAVHLIHFEFRSLAQFLEAKRLVRIVEGVPHETGPGANVFSVHRIKIKP